MLESHQGSVPRIAFSLGGNDQSSTHILFLLVCPMAPPWKVQSLGHTSTKANAEEKKKKKIQPVFDLGRQYFVQNKFHLRGRKHKAVVLKDQQHHLGTW